jgi:hypothetical protein
MTNELEACIDFDDIDFSPEAALLCTQAVTRQLIEDLQNEERDAVIRASFRDFMEASGGGLRLMMRAFKDPLPGERYGSSFIDRLWGCYKFAALSEKLRSLGS